MLYTNASLLRAAGTYDERYWQILNFGKNGSDCIAVADFIESVKDLHHPLDHPLLVLRCCTDPAAARRVAQVLAHAMAVHVEHHFCEKHPDDPRVRACNVAVGRFLRGEMPKQELMGIGLAASEAARGAAVQGFPAVADAGWAAAAAAVDAFYTVTRGDVEDTGWAVWATAEVAVDASGEGERNWQLNEFRRLLTVC